MFKNILDSWSSDPIFKSTWQLWGWPNLSSFYNSWKEYQIRKGTHGKTNLSLLIDNVAIRWLNLIFKKRHRFSFLKKVCQNVSSSRSSFNHWWECSLTHLILATALYLFNLKVTSLEPHHECSLAIGVLSLEPRHWSQWDVKYEPSSR